MDPERGARVGLLPRDGNVSKMQWFEAPRCFAFHCLNSYDDGANVVVDYPQMVASATSDIYEGTPILARWILDRETGRLSETIVDEHGSEFPRMNETCQSLAYRFGYTATIDKVGDLGGTVKHDMQSGSRTIHDYGLGRTASEAVFVQREGATDEDDGYVMAYVYDANRDKSDVVILAAQDFSGPPIAAIELPVRVPFGFHGNWAPDTGR